MAAELIMTAEAEQDVDKPMRGMNGSGLALEKISSVLWMPAFKQFAGPR